MCGLGLALFSFVEFASALHKDYLWPHWSPETNFGLAQAMTKTELGFQMAGTQDGKDRHPHPSATFIFIRDDFFLVSVITHYSNPD